jgi:hypothetical protein
MRGLHWRRFRNRPAPFIWHPDQYGLDLRAGGDPGENDTETEGEAESETEALPRVEPESNAKVEVKSETGTDADADAEGDAEAEPVAEAEEGEDEKKVDPYPALRIAGMTEYFRTVMDCSTVPGIDDLISAEKVRALLRDEAKPVAQPP